MKFSKTSFLFLFIFLFSKSLFAQFATSEQTIVSGIYTFIINTEWKNEKNFKQFIIGVLDKDSSFYKQCVETSRREPSRRELAFGSRGLRKARGGACQVLYVNK